MHTICHDGSSDTSTIPRPSSAPVGANALAATVALMPIAPSHAPRYVLRTSTVLARLLNLQKAVITRVRLPREIPAPHAS